MNELLKDLSKEFEDKEFAHGYMQSHCISRLAAQIHALRKQRNLTQAELSKKSGIAQERISLLESADFESITLKTLHKLSKAFDVDLRVAFEPFSAGILDVVKLEPAKLEVRSRTDDLQCLQGNIGRPYVVLGGGAPSTVTTGTNFSKSPINAQAGVSTVLTLQTASI